MKFLIILTILLLINFAHSKQNQKLIEDWNKFKNDFNKSYPNRGIESLRQNIWLNNMIYINKHNIDADKGKHSYKLAMNEFGDFVIIILLKLYLTQIILLHDSFF
jgi:hypothetical protein